MNTFLHITLFVLVYVLVVTVIHKSSIVISLNRHFGKLSYAACITTMWMLMLVSCLLWTGFGYWAHRYIGNTLAVMSGITLLGCIYCIPVNAKYLCRK